MDHAELMSIRRNAAFLTIAASQYETMGYLVLEPMSLGCPFVTTAVGGIPEFIKGMGITVFLYHPRTCMQ